MEKCYSATIREMSINRPPVKVAYPKVLGLSNLFVQVAINEKIINLVHSLINEQMGSQENIVDMIGTYEIKLNEKGLISIYFENYIYWYHAAHGMTVARSITMDLCTGATYKFRDLFKPGSNYTARLNEIIKAQIAEREIPTIEPFESIDTDQEYYLTPNALVIYYQLYRYTPYAYGFLEFEIPYTEIADIINPQGPIAKLM
jgi:hypothetical protein